MIKVPTFAAESEIKLSEKPTFSKDGALHEEYFELKCYPELVFEGLS